MDRDMVCVLDVLGSARMIQSYIEGVSRNEFLESPQLQDSVIRRIEIMGEAAGRLSATFREDHPEIPWVQIRGMRNRVIHGYDNVDMDIVWDTVTQDLLRLIPSLECLVPSEAE